MDVPLFAISLEPLRVEYLYLTSRFSPVAFETFISPVLKQGQYEPLPVEKQILTIYAGTKGFVDHLPLDTLKKYEHELHAFVEDKHPDLFTEIVKKRELNDELSEKINKALEEFNAIFNKQ